MNGLRVSKFEDLLTLLLSEAYYSIIDSDLNEVTKSAGKREKDMIKSDLIIWKQLMSQTYNCSLILYIFADYFQFHEHNRFICYCNDKFKK